MIGTSRVAASAQDNPLLNKGWLTFALALYAMLFMWVRWYEGVYGWSAGLDAFAPEFETYWMNFLYIEIVLEIVTASILWGYLWKSRDHNLAAITPREELRRNITHLVWLVAYAWAIYWGADYFTKQDGIWHQVMVRDTYFTPSYIIGVYLVYPICIITGTASFLYAKTRLPHWAKGVSLPYLIMVAVPFMILLNGGLNKWGHTFGFMEELFVASQRYGFVIFGWLALAVMGVVLQIMDSLCPLMGKEIYESIDDGHMDMGRVDISIFGVTGEITTVRIKNILSIPEKTDNNLLVLWLAPGSFVLLVGMISSATYLWSSLVYLVSIVFAGWVSLRFIVEAGRTKDSIMKFTYIFCCLALYVEVLVVCFWYVEQVV